MRFGDFLRTAVLLFGGILSGSHATSPLAGAIASVRVSPSPAGRSCRLSTWVGAARICRPSGENWYPSADA